MKGLKQFSYCIAVAGLSVIGASHGFHVIGVVAPVEVVWEVEDKCSEPQSQYHQGSALPCEYAL